jgi:hypothetical protein
MKAMFPGKPSSVTRTVSHVTDGVSQRVAHPEKGHRWLTLKAAAQALGVSQQTVVKKRNCGELAGIRVQVGARTAWRMYVDLKGYDGQPTLFDRYRPAIL